MNDKALLDTVNDALNEAELRSEEIPAIDLYVDQILNLINDKLSEGSERYRDRVLTKTMINNYSKDGIITPVKGKKYNKEQILQMLTVYTLKGTLSINEIKRTLKGAYASGDFGGEELTALYDRYLDIKNDNREYAKMALDGIIERNGLDMESDVDYISAICALVAFSAQLRNMAQAMIDDRFPDESEEKCFWLNRKTIGLSAHSTDWDVLFSDRLADKIVEDYKSIVPVYKLFMAAEEECLKKNS